jgi:hypothetical protein
MKFLHPGVTAILCSHRKHYLAHALHALVNQSRTDLQILVLDSGQWINRSDELSQAMHRIYRRFRTHPLVDWVSTGEGPELRRDVCPVAWATNEALRAGLVRGNSVFMAYDDDVHHVDFVARMAGYLDDNPDADAVWCAQDRVRLDRNGNRTLVGHIPANAPRQPGTWDCQVDGAQIMMRRSVLDSIGDPWLPESPDVGSCRHSDGIFLEKVGRVAGVVPNIPETLVTHRFTPLSTYTPS